MSVITGLWLKYGDKVEPYTLDLLGEQSKQYAPDQATSFAKDSIGMVSQVLRTHARSFYDKGIASDATGNIVAFDGRIDNYEDLCRQLDMLPASTPDSALILAGYRKWGYDVLGRLVGDWSLSLWDDAKRILCLARDHAGTRTLYYADTPRFTIWSTYPEGILAYIGSQELDREYVEHYLTAVPTRDLTPYAGIKASPAGCFLMVPSRGNIRRVEYWSPLVMKDLHYRRDEDYQEEFLSLFSQSVKRRTDGSGLIAHLSGGVDSSSIVCTADWLAVRSGASSSLATVSFYDDHEPDWNEKPFFIAVEEHRGIRGTHFEVSASARNFLPPPVPYLLPGSDRSFHDRERDFANHPALSGVRAILTGYGGDELLGGPPDPLPELGDAMMTLSLRELCRSSFEWAMSKRVNLMSLAVDTVEFIGKSYPRISSVKVIPPPWLRKQGPFIPSIDRKADRPWTIGYLPSSISNAKDWRRLLDTLPHQNLANERRYEYRYPYLDRNLVEYLLRLPPKQLVRPGRRRHMMRAALRGIVPETVLERRRKAFISRGPIVALECCRSHIISLLDTSILGDMNIIDVKVAKTVLESPSSSWSNCVPQLIRLLDMEIWLRQAIDQMIVNRNVASA